MTDTTLPPRSRVAWCAGCESYIEPEASGEQCPGGCEREQYGHPGENPRKLRLRVGYICETCYERFIFFSAEDYRAHQEADDGPY